jgi:hypothetical protein
LLGLRDSQELFIAINQVGESRVEALLKESRMDPLEVSEKAITLVLFVPESLEKPSWSQALHRELYSKAYSTGAGSRSVRVAKVKALPL